jgi:hypothetical protein
MKMPYVSPKDIKTWLTDDPESERYELKILNNGTVCIASGRFAHSSGATICTWAEFLDGKIDRVVVNTIGAVALGEAKAHLASGPL